MRLVFALSLSLGAVERVVAAQDGSSGAVWATPHDSYSSSIGVLGCKVNTNRVAYWPGSVDCNNICVSLSYEDRSVNLLRVDQSSQSDSTKVVISATRFSLLHSTPVF